MSSDHDLRVIKTRRLIKDAFVKLSGEKGFKNITVNDISDKAMINRSTFYLFIPCCMKKMALFTSNQLSHTANTKIIHLFPQEVKRRVPKKL